MAQFHSRTGTLVTLSNNNKTAQRNHPTQEFNNGVVLSAEPLRDNQLFEVKIDKKVNSWSGSLEIGVSSCDPTSLNFPTSATGFREGSWVMSGCSILKDGHSTIEEYGRDLDQLGEGDRVGVLRTSNGALHFFVNGIDQGPAATGIPNKVYAVVDMYGKCAQVTIIDDSNRDLGDHVLSNNITNEAIAEAGYVHSNERLVFHERCGTLIRLSNMGRTAERIRALDEFNNGVIMTNRPLKDDELFEIRLDHLVDKWSGSIEVGITTHNPGTLDFPATMTNMRSGTIMMSGCGILTNGKGTRREYGEYNLDELTEGDRIGLIKKASGALHYYINGIDQGVAATRTPQVVWGVVDLYGMAVKVTITDPTEDSYHDNNENVSTRANNFLRQFREDTDDEITNSMENSDILPDRLTFHTRCGSHAAVISGRRTAHRPNAMDDFNNGVVLTERHLRPGEMFEVRLDRMVDKWAGSIEIGVTTHLPTELDFPSTMTNMRSGTWMMTGNGVMHNGTTVIDEYGQNLDRLAVGDRVGVLRKEDGTLHFYVNGIDQGAAASNVPAAVYGVIDLYGQAAQATIIDSTDRAWPELEGSTEGDVDQLKFHQLHGRNATISNRGRTASRPNARGEFNDAIVISARSLRDNELFEVTIDKMVDRWSGSIEAGVTLIQPDVLDFPNTMTDIDYDTWMLSGSAIMQDGSTIRNGYPLDLDTLSVGSRIGMMRCDDGTLHYFLDGVDQGVACSDIPTGVYAVIDLYGQCAQVTISSGACVEQCGAEIVVTSTRTMQQSIMSTRSTEVCQRFSHCCGKNIALQNNGSTATRTRSYSHGIVFSTDPLKADEIFEVKIEQVAKQWTGSLCIGLTSLVISDNTPLSILPCSAQQLRSKVTWLVIGSDVKRNGEVIKENYCHSLQRLEVGNRVGVRRGSDGTMHVYINGEDMGVAATHIPKNVFGIVDVFGKVQGITITSTSKMETPRLVIMPVSESNDSMEEEQEQESAEIVPLEFLGNHGKNIHLSNSNRTARRVASYNQAVLASNKPLQRNQLFKIKIDKLNQRWSSSLIIGVLGFNPKKLSFPVSAMNIKKQCWLIQGDAVYRSGVKVKERYGPNLDSLHEGHTVGVYVEEDATLHLSVNGADQGVAAIDIPNTCYVVIDLYGQCEQISIVSDQEELTTSRELVEDREKADIEDGMKEKACRTPEVNPVKNCEYQNLCARLVSSLGIPEGFFSADGSWCYCETCYKLRGDEPYYRRGEPPRDYALPLGWCKFTLRVAAKAEVLNVREKWHMAYSGAHMSAARRILDTGDLIYGDLASQGLLLMSQPIRFDEKNHPEEEQDVRQINLSPTIRYAGSEHFSPKHDFKDTKSRKRQFARVAFQVYVKPGSYKIGPQSVGANEQIDARFNNNELEWSTKERGATVLAALLVKIE